MYYNRLATILQEIHEILTLCELGGGCHFQTSIQREDGGHRGGSVAGLCKLGLA